MSPSQEEAGFVCVSGELKNFTVECLDRQSVTNADVVVQRCQSTTVLVTGKGCLKSLQFFQFYNEKTLARCMAKDISPSGLPKSHRPKTLNKKIAYEE